MAVYFHDLLWFQDGRHDAMICHGVIGSRPRVGSSRRDGAVFDDREVGKYPKLTFPSCIQSRLCIETYWNPSFDGKWSPQKCLKKKHGLLPWIDQTSAGTSASVTLGAAWRKTRSFPSRARLREDGWFRGAIFSWIDLAGTCMDVLWVDDFLVNRLGKMPAPKP